MPTPVTTSTKPSVVEDYSSFSFARARLDPIISEWSSVTKETERCRLLRYMKMDKETLNSLGLFKEDEIYVAARLIDTNVRAEQPQYISYITQSRRSIILNPSGGQTNSAGTLNLEKAFTSAARYQGWEKPFIRVVDGSISLGWDFVEVCLDISKAGHFSVEHVGHDNLLFDQETEDIQNQELVVRQIRYSAIQLKEAATEFGFAQAQVDKITGEQSGNGDNKAKTKDILYNVFKCFYKKDGVVNVGWYGGNKSDAWLKKPEPLFLGRRNIAKGLTESTGAKDAVGQSILDYPKLLETDYPFYILPYVESENPKITEVHGRAFLDEPAQEGASAILSGIVNGTVRAANVYASPNPSGVPPTDSAAPQQIACKLKHGGIYDKPINFFHTEYPPLSAMQGLQTVTQINKSETSKIDSTVNNRRDSRKTATEIQAATLDAGQLGSVKVTTLSSFIRSVYGRCYEIYSNRVLQKKITVTAEILQLCAAKYDIKAAGDTEVVERAEKTQKLMQAWPVISKTAIANEFLKLYLNTAFPDDARVLCEALDKGEQGKQLVSGMAGMIKELVMDGTTGQIKPEFAKDAAELQQLQQQVVAYMQGGQEGTGSSGSVAKPQESTSNSINNSSGMDNIVVN